MDVGRQIAMTAITTGSGLMEGLVITGLVMMLMTSLIYVLFV